MTVSRSTLGAMEFALAFAVVFIWGTNFAVIKLGIAEFPPLLFAALRFGLAALPWCIFIRRPNIRWRYLAAIGLLLGAGQFGVLFIAMRADISAGLASVVIQAQVFFTVAGAGGANATVETRGDGAGAGRTHGLPFRLQPPPRNASCRIRRCRSDPEDSE